MTTEYEQVLTEAIINAAVTGEKQAERVKFDPAIPFSKQTERMLKGRWAGVPPSFVLGLMRFSEHWDERLDDCSFEFRPDPAAGVDMKRVEELSSPEKQ